MKTNIIFLVLVFGVLLSFSCKKEEKTQGSWTEVSGTEAVSVSSTKEPGYALKVNTSFYTLVGDDTGAETDKNKWAANMTLGEKLETGKVRKMTYEGTGKVSDFIEVRRDTGTEGYALVSQVAVGGYLAVITDEKANLYRSPKTVDVSGVILPRKTIVVYFPETEKSGFVQIDGDNVLSNNNYIRSSAISRKQSDIQSSILLQTALALTDTPTNKIRKEAILESAVMDYSDSVFYEEIYALAYPNTEGTVDSVFFEED